MQASVNNLRAGKRGSNKNDGDRKYENGRQGSSPISRLGSKVELSRSRQARSFVSVQMHRQEHGMDAPQTSRPLEEFHRTSDDTILQGYADSDWARDRQNLESTCHAA